MNSFSDADRAAIHAALDVLLHMAGALTREDLFDFYAETDRDFYAETDRDFYADDLRGHDERQ